MTIYGQTLGGFKRENNECIRNGEKTKLHQIKNIGVNYVITLSREVKNTFTIAKIKKKISSN